MHSILYALCAALIIGIAAQPVHSQPDCPTRASRLTQNASRSLVLACNLSAMTSAQRHRHNQVAERLRLATEHTLELADGYQFQYAYDPALFQSAAEFITLESRCCPFYHFRLEQSPRDGPILLTITGPEDAKSFIRDALAPGQE